MDNFKRLDDQRVRKFIDWSQKEARIALVNAGIHSHSIVEINYEAWQLLKVVVRGDIQHRYDNDFEAAAAEHYMYIRFLAGKTGDPICHSAPTIYAAKKVWDQLFGRLQSGQAQGGHPVLPSNPYITVWGNKGVADGLSDYKKVSGGKNYNHGNAVEALTSFAFEDKTAKKMGDYTKNNTKRIQDLYAQIK